MSLPIYQRVAVTDAGDIIPGAEYTVINENTGVAQPIYSDRTGLTLLTPPYFADSAGTIQFFIAQGTTFRVAASGGVGTYTDRYVYGVSAAVLALADGSANINRVGSDGSALTIQKDGATVGSIGTISGDMTIGTGDAGLRFNNPYGELLPHNVSTNSGTDATVTLGSGAVRFKDLHLAGGVYLGGTSAANKLDDYEEGTWTPVGINMTVSVNSATYVKIGRQVTLNCYLTASNGVASSARLSGMPFQSLSNGYSTGIINISNGNPILVYNPIARTSNNSTAMDIFKNNSTPVNGDEIDSGQIIFGITYFTSA